MLIAVQSSEGSRGSAPFDLAPTVERTTTLFKGTATVLGGKGRFEGAKGDGTGTGARLTPLAAGADLYNDLVINVRRVD
jgi:hypothetical protein